MKKKYLILFIIFTIIIEILITNMFINKNEYNNDSVKINELVSQIKENYGDSSKYPNSFEYTIIDNNESIIYKTDKSTSKSLNEAYKNKDTIIDIIIDNEIKGKIIINNNFGEIINKNNKTYVETIVAISIVQILSFIIYYVFLYKTTIKPFKKMKDFALRVASGNLDIPLQMDKNNNFGAFTEAFDIMRSEIKKARKAEKKAVEDKKELVAKLSHDIRTPISSIKSSSELGFTISEDKKIKEYFKSINQKSDQMNTLVNNLFNATLKELEELNVNPINIKSIIIKELINNSDYLKKNKKFNIPECAIYADRLHLQQVFDNIFVNSYKYANTTIQTEAFIGNEYLIISIKDFGDSIKDEEIPLLTEKYKRGKNTNDIDGAGLGLYISKELMKKMNGKLEIRNNNPGFEVIIYLRII